MIDEKKFCFVGRKILEVKLKQATVCRGHPVVSSIDCVWDLKTNKPTT
jgi:hypothetical protein